MNIRFALPFPIEYCGCLLAPFHLLANYIQSDFESIPTILQIVECKSINTLPASKNNGLFYGQSKKSSETPRILFKLMNFSDIYLDIYLYV